MTDLRLAILISGRGSNMEALVKACAQPDYPASVATVISNRPDAAGLETATRHGIATGVVDHKRFDDRESFEVALDAAIMETGANLVCLAGFMRLLGAGFVERRHNRLINIHPSILPAYPGLDTHERVLADGGRFAGCTVHFVRPAMDAGPIIVQAAVPVLPQDTPDSLAGRVLEQEHRIYPLAVRWIAEGRVSVHDERVMVAEAGRSADAVINPPAD
ncbi:MAG: phosphoribosylglycinamide formyltransferase [Alphaproteobacteria bacterium]|jgi:phosphoribosylglycinamide formyltransferase-1|nr:phosphoribosylglycinamide formyltransferase [Alphaproteobacteria bacterium]